MIMKKTDYTKKMLMVLLAITGLVTLSACGSDDDETTEIGGNLNAALIISGKNYGVLPYGSFTNWEDGTASFIFGTQSIASGSMDRNSGYTYVAIRIPYTTGDIPLGTFSGNDVDLDFDVNRIATSQKCDLTGWSTDITMTVAKLGDKYIVDVTTNILHIFQNDEESNNGNTGSLTFHYEGRISTVSYY